MSPAPSRLQSDLAALFDEHFDYVWATLRRLGVRAADREDLAHEVFLRVHSRIGDYDTTRPARPWLFGFAYRVAADHRRLAKHRVEILGGHGEARAPDLPADDQIAAHEARDLVIEALQAVALDRLAVLLLHDVDDVPVPAIAEQMQIPVNTAYSRLRLARMELATAVKRLRIARGMS